jgi:hypothetical protein
MSNWGGWNNRRVDEPEPENSASPVKRLPVDGHVHFHHRRFVVPTLDAALGNLRRVAGRSEGLVGTLLLTQTRAEHVFEELGARPSIGGWTLMASIHEAETLIARKDGADIAIVCGRQVRAEAGLEVLALGTRGEFPDGRSLADTIQAVHESGALTVLPWGFGKWLGRRRDLVRRTLAASGRDKLFIGDNGGRLDAPAAPRIIREFERLGFRSLPGTDPFPFGGDFRRVGAFGFLADVAGAEEAPWTCVRDWLATLTVSPRPFGHACRPVRFVSNQVGIQIYNRLFRSVAA